MGHANTGTIVLAYVTKNPDRPLSLDELQEATSLERTQVSNALGNLLRSAKYPELEQLQRGVYRWNTKSADKKSNRTEILISVLTTKEDGSMLVRDTEDGAVYVLRPLNF